MAGDPSRGIEGFLLTRQWRDTPEGIELSFWAATEGRALRIRLTGQEAVCFVVAEERLADWLPAGRVRGEPLPLQTLDGHAVEGLYFRSQRDLVEISAQLREAGLRILESDLKPADRYLMERFIRGAFQISTPPVGRGRALEALNPQLRAASFSPSLRAVALDIETGDLDGDLYSIAVTGADAAAVFLVAHSSWTAAQRERLTAQTGPARISILPDERSALEALLEWLAEHDPDLILGWNLIEFDLALLERRCRRLGLRFTLGRGGESAAILPGTAPNQRSVARIPGRVALDGIEVLRNATWSFESYSLEAVGRELLGRGKLIEGGDQRVKEIRRLYREAPDQLAAYNVEDCRLTEAIFERAGLIDFCIARASLTGLPLDRSGGSVAAFDHLYLPRLHRAGYVAPNVGEPMEGQESPGGYVMDSKSGLYENVLVLDFKSLYPSIIRSFKIDPLGMAAAGDDPVEGFRGARFSRERHILPTLIAELWAARDQAKASGNEPLSRAIKIIMNSFYGVLGSPGCRFFDPRLASSITLRGHEILRRSRERIEALGYAVIYGDTDSLFVLVGPGPEPAACAAIGAELTRSLNRFWSETLPREHGVESYLEIELEQHYLRFFMPTIRGSELGSKKRYAGLVRRGVELQVRFTGLESVRSDWTPLAREFQRELFRRIFLDQPFEDYVRELAAELRAGKRDHQLVYRKRLRRPLEDYQVNVPPHVQAARKAKKVGRYIEYVMTQYGPEPLERHPTAPDYDHYLEKQIAPAGDGILQCKGTSVQAILDNQLTLF